jgi:hypothetical protein
VADQPDGISVNFFLRFFRIAFELDAGCHALIFAENGMKRERSMGYIDYIA